MERDALEAFIEQAIAEQQRAMLELSTSTPKVLDGHSDGKRVRYVRHEAAERALLDVLALLEEVR